MWFPLTSPVVACTALLLVTFLARCRYVRHGQVPYLYSSSAVFATAVELIMGTFNGVLSSALRVLDCETVTLNGEELRVNVFFPAVRCDQPEYNVPRLAAVVMLGFYVVTFVLLVVLAWRNSPALSGLRRPFRESKADSRGFSWVQNWWLMFAIRRVVLVVIVVFVRDFSDRMAAMTLLHLGCALLQLSAKPFHGIAESKQQYLADAVQERSTVKMWRNLRTWLWQSYRDSNTNEAVALVLLCVLSLSLEIASEQPGPDTQWALAGFVLITMLYFFSRMIKSVVGMLKKLLASASCCKSKKDALLNPAAGSVSRQLERERERDERRASSRPRGETREAEGSCDYHMLREESDE